MNKSTVLSLVVCSAFGKHCGFILNSRRARLYAEASMQPLVQTAGCFVTHLYTSQCHDICTSSIAVTPMHYTATLFAYQPHLLHVFYVVVFVQPSLV